MKKNSLKTILEDFFSWKHVLVWVILLLLTGVGIVLAGESGLQYGKTLFPGNSLGIDDSTGTLGPCVIISNSGSSTYFVPTKTAYEFDHFKNAISFGPTIGSIPSLSYSFCLNLGCNIGTFKCATGYSCVTNSANPQGICVKNTCVPITPCGPTDQCGTDSCGVACGPRCPAVDFCNAKHLCQPITTSCGNPLKTCPQPTYCTVIGGAGVCIH